MGSKKKGNLKTRIKRVKTPARLIYALSLVLLIIAMFQVIGLAADLQWSIESRKGYSLNDLYNDFQEGAYTRLCSKVRLNSAAGVSLSDDEQELAEFAECYTCAVNYRMYKENNMTAEAQAQLDEFREHENAIHRKLILDRLDNIKNIYGIY